MTRSRPLFLSATLLAAACTLEWNGDAPALPVIGDPPALSSFTKLNGVIAGRASLMTGADGAPWTAFCEFWAQGSGNNGRNCKRMHLVRLGPPEDAPKEELIDADSFALHGQELYELRDDMSTMTLALTMHRPGDPTSADVGFALPDGHSGFLVNDAGAADVFVYFVDDSATTQVHVYRRDRSYERVVPLPTGIDLGSSDRTKQPTMQLTAAGDTLIVRAPGVQSIAYSTLDEGTVTLQDARPSAGAEGDFFIDEPRSALITFDEGILSVPLDGSPARAVSAGHPTSIDSVAVKDSWLYFADATGLWRVPLDPSFGENMLIQAGAARARAFGPHGEIAYGYDPASRYAGGSGDGWLGDWQFMERGRQLRFSADGARLHFLEHAATLGTYGDLTAATGPKNPTTLLAINVHSWDELADGRLLAIENAIQAGTWNRLVVIDEVRSEKHWVVPTAAEFFLVPGKREIIVDAVSGASGYDILRVPAP